MMSVFNLSKLNALLQDFYTLTQIRITVFDNSFEELASYPEQISSFCQLIRTDAAACEECRRCDAHACEIALQRHAPYTYQCHAGLTESIAPLYLGNIVIGYLLFGHVFSYASYQEGWESIKKRCSPYQIDMEMLEETVYERPLITEEYITSASHILQAVASFLCLERMVKLHQEELPVQIDEYINKHYTEEISVRAICEHFHIGKTSLYEIAKQNYGMGIAEHIRHLRIEKAKELLRDCPDKRISEIAFACGFNDYNYFITIFKRETGLPPKQYRQTGGKNE
ncbi:PocR ligand-binding domain-containing protein [Robinsoniella peoriensis]